MQERNNRLPANAGSGVSSSEADDSWFQLGGRLLEQSDWAGAAEVFEICASRCPRNPGVYVNLGIAKWQSGRLRGARRAFEQALELDPESREALHGLAGVSLQQEDLETAFDLLCRLLSLGEKTPDILYNLALISHRRGRLEEAIGMYERAIEENPRFAEALLNLGHVLMDTGRQQEARARWRQAAHADPRLVQNYRILITH